MSTIKIKRTSGSTTPTGLTFGELAYVQGIKSIYIGQTAGDPALRIGAEVDTSTALGTSDNKIPSQNAVKTYVDSVVSGGASLVSALNGITGSITLTGGTGISVTSLNKVITVTNTGVISVNGSTGAITNVAKTDTANTFTPLQTFSAGIASTGATFTSSTGLITTQKSSYVGSDSAIVRVVGADASQNPYNSDIRANASATANTTHTLPSTTGTLLNTNSAYVSGITGTANQITVSASTGSVTLSLPSTVTVPGSLNVTTDLTVTGNLTVNGTSTTVNSNTMTVDDPIIVLGTSGGVPISASDGGKSRGVAFTYYDDVNTIGKTGFFGFRNPGQGAVFGAYERVNILNDATQAGSTLAMIETYGLSVRANQNVNTLGNHVFSSLSTTNNKQVIFEDHTGYVLIPNTLGTSGYIIKSNGGTSQPTWIDAAAAGFTAYAATQLATARSIGLTGDVSGSASFDGTANINISATIAANSVALGTDTTGDYVAAVAVSGIGLSVAGSGENATYTVTSGATSNNVVSQIVARDSSGNFSAGTITAALTGNASTASTLQTARSIGLTGDVSGSASFNGSADINITATIAANSVALGTDTTGNYVATLSTSSTGLTVANSGAESAAVTVNFATITSGLNMGTFSFASGEFTNSSGTISLGTVDGGSY
jgi:hypothetical protein